MRNNAWVALAIVGIIIAFAISSTGGGSGLGMIDVQEDGVTIVNNTSVVDFQSPFNVTDAAGTAEIDLPLADDNVFVGSAAGVPTAAALTDCDDFNEAVSYATGSNTWGCEPFSTKVKISHQVAATHWVVPGWYCQNPGNIQFDVNEIVFVPIHVSQDETYVAIGINVTTAVGGSIARLGIYNGVMTSQGLEIGSLLLDAGTVSTATTGAKTISISQTLQKGQYYWLAVVSDGATSATNCQDAAAVSTSFEGFATGLGSAPRLLTFVDVGGGTGAFAVTPSPDTIAATLYVGVVQLQE